jgi:glucokinase
MRRIGAIDIGGTKIAAGIVREDGTLLHRNECQTDAQLGFPNAIDRIESMLRELVEKCGSIDGIGVACPGPLDPIAGIIGNVGTLPGWENAHLAAEIAARFGLSVAVENDADAAALAEYAWGTVRPSGTLIYVTVSTGIGGGIVQSGKLYRGVHGSHPELGHQLIDPSGPLCYCGLSGCWESLASGTAMSAHYHNSAPEGAPLTAAEICDLARQGDLRAGQVVRHTAHYLALGLANLVTLFAPESIRLGGGVMRSSDLFLNDVRAQVLRLCTQVPAEHTSITVSLLGPDTGLLGAAQSWLLRNP